MIACSLTCPPLTFVLLLLLYHTLAQETSSRHFVADWNPMRKGKSIILVLVFFDAKLTAGEANVRIAALFHVRT